MIVLLRRHASTRDIESVCGELARWGASAKVLHGGERVAVRATTYGPPMGAEVRAALLALGCVDEVMAPPSEHPRLDGAPAQVVLAPPTSASAAVDAVTLGAKPIVLAAGPCTVDADVDEIARQVRSVGGSLLRGGVWKARTSPYQFAGGGSDALATLRAAGASHGLPLVVEVLDEHSLAEALDHVALLQIGARNGQNHAFLRSVGQTGRPVLLKRHPGATLDEWLLCAEHLLVAGCPGLVLCERGIRTFEHASRYTLDVAAIALAKAQVPAPVFVDPSHAAGAHATVIPLALAAVAAGADGLLVETHTHPERARSDAAQALDGQTLTSLAQQLGQVARAVGRSFTGTVNHDEDKRSDRSGRLTDRGHDRRPNPVLGLQATHGPHVDGDVP